MSDIEMSEKERLYAVIRSGITAYPQLRDMGFKQNILNRYRLCGLRKLKNNGL